MEPLQFLLSDEQLSMQDELRRLLEPQCESRRLHAAFDADAPYDATLWGALCGFGVAAMTLPEADDGLDLELIDLALVAEMLGRFAAPAPFIGHVLATLAISRGGSTEQRAHWLPRLASGEVLAAYAPAGADAADGSHPYAPNAASAGLVVVETAAGLGLLDPTAPGVEIRAMGGIDRTRRIDALTCPPELVEPLGGGQDLAARVRDAALVLIAADAYGGATRCVEMATAYAGQREQFGVPIAEFQALRHQLANMALLAEPGRGLWWFAAHAFDHLPDEAELAAAQAKAHCAEAFLQVARDNIEIHGGIGYTWEADPQIWLKRAMFDFAWLGAPMVHRARAADLAGW